MLILGGINVSFTRLALEKIKGTYDAIWDWILKEEFYGYGRSNGKK
jgi:hypothetical protein